MGTNIEIKASASNLRRTELLAKELSKSAVEVLHQEDIFFRCQKGRLKLRIFSPKEGELIHYHRPDQSGAKISNYIISKTDNPQVLKDALSAALGVLITVRKKRLLYLVEQTRIHLDEVEDLGTFIELEVVMKPGQTPEEGHLIAKDLMKRLEIDDSHLISCAYADLLAKKNQQCDLSKTSSSTPGPSRALR
jgi:predicted adenylyl cyclase CyaB